jgi:RNA polymerase sigma factor for flagellar operon FliA
MSEETFAAMSDETLPPLPPLTPAQIDRVALAPRIVEKALAVVRRRFRGGLTDEELLAIGRLALYSAARTFDPDFEGKRGVPFGGYAWPFVHGKMWNALRKETRFQRAARAGAYKAVEAQHEDAGREGYSESSGVAPVQAFSDAIVAGMMTQVVAQALCQRELSDPEAPLEYTQARTALQTALAELSKEDRRLIELHYFQDVPIYLTGEPLKMGRTVVKARHRGLLKRLGARLRSLGISEAPAPRAGMLPSDSV